MMVKITRYTCDHCGEVIPDGEFVTMEFHRTCRDEAVALLERLAAQTEYGERMRRSYTAASEELHAVKHERDGLRARVRQLEANIEALQGERRGDDQHRQLDRMMRERPHHRRGTN